MKRLNRQKFSQAFTALYIGKTIVFIASGLMGIFLPIFLYNLFHQSFVVVLTYSGIVSLAYAVFIPWGIRVVNYVGFRRMLLLGRVFAAALYIPFYFVTPDYALLMVAIHGVFLTLFRLAYWVPYRVDFAIFTNNKNRGKNIGILSALQDAVGVLTPALAAFIITLLGYPTLFLLVIVLELITIIPYSFLPDVVERFTWSYRRTWRELVSPKRRRAVLAFMGDGAESTLVLLVWPIFIYEVLHGNILEVGAISTFIVAAGIVMQIIVGSVIDTSIVRERRLLHVGSAFHALGWLAKIFIVSAFHVFLVGAYHRMTRILTSIPFDALAYEAAADQGHYIDEFTILHEIAVHIGRVIAVIVVILISLVAPIQWTFIIGIVTTFCLNILQTERMHFTTALVREKILTNKAISN